MAQQMVALRWAAVAGIIFLLIVVPFVLFADDIERHSLSLISTGGAIQKHLLIAGILATDVLLPIPSSIVSTLGGTFLGVAGGTLASTVGMSAGGLLGYVCGRVLGVSAVRRFISPASVQHAERLATRFGPWAIALSRPVPVLAEASLILAGLHRMPFGPFVLNLVLANTGVSLVYAWAGARSATESTFVFAVAAALGLPAVAMTLIRRTGWGAESRDERSPARTRSHLH